MLGQASGLIRRYPWPTLGSTLVVGILPMVLSLFLLGIAVSAWLWVGNELAPLFVGAALLLFVLIVATLGCLCAHAAMVTALMADRLGDRVSFRGCVAGGFRRIVPLAALSVCLAVALVSGFIALIVPAIILGAMWFVAAPALVAEDLGVFGALGRSRALTAGNRRRIFGLIAVMAMIYWFATAVVALPLRALDGASGASLGGPALAAIADIVGTLISLAFWVICMAIWGALAGAAYLELRTLKEGPLTDGLAEVFA